MTKSYLWGTQLVFRAIPCTSAAWAMDLDFSNSRQRLGQTLNLLRFRVRLSEYYNFGRIEPGRPQHQTFGSCGS